MERASPVDADKLWRDRVRSELQHQRNWQSEYGFMVERDGEGADGQPGGSTAATAGGAKDASMASTADDFKSKMSYAGMKSTAHGSYLQRPSPELRSLKEHNRQRHHFT